MVADVTGDGLEWVPDPAGIYFSDRFKISPHVLEEYGAFDISVVSDLPVFVDPFLLFNSDKEQYQALHDNILDYLRFLRDHAHEPLEPGRIKSWYTFSEVRQNWLGFSVGSNRGHGLGRKFAVDLHAALGDVLDNFGDETITASSHVEKLALIRSGVGRDTISDLTTNLIKHYLLRYTSEFAVDNLAPADRKTISVPRAKFNYNTQTWATGKYDLPFTDGDFVILTPTDLLTKDDTWINQSDMLRSFDQLPDVVGNDQLRADVTNYLRMRLTRRSSEREQREVRRRALLQFPELIDCYIKLKEDTGEQAVAISRDKVDDTQEMLHDQVQRAAHDLAEKTNLFAKPWTSYDEALQAIETFRDYVENQDGWRVINRGRGKGFANEAEVQGFFGLLLQPSRFDVNREANNGRGPVDFKISIGLDNTLIEFKLAKSSSLERNMERQVAVYEKANKTNSSVFVVIGYTQTEITRVARVMTKLGLDQPGARKVVVIDASPKASASKV